MTRAEAAGSSERYGLRGVVTTIDAPNAAAEGNPVPGPASFRDTEKIRMPCDGSSAPSTAGWCTLLWEPRGAWPARILGWCGELDRVHAWTPFVRPSLRRSRSPAAACQGAASQLVPMTSGKIHDCSSATGSTSMGCSTTFRACGRPAIPRGSPAARSQHGKDARHGPTVSGRALP